MSLGARIIVLGLLTGLLLGYVEPIKGYLAQREQLERRRARLAELIQQRAEARRELRMINTPQVLEKRAREFGLIKVGERAYVIRGELAPPPGAVRS